MRYFILLTISISVLYSNYSCAQLDTIPKLRKRITYKENSKIVEESVSYDQYGRPVEAYYLAEKEEYRKEHQQKIYYENADTFSLDHVQTRAYNLPTYIGGMKELRRKDIAYNRRSAFITQETQHFDRQGRLWSSHKRVVEDSMQGNISHYRRSPPRVYHRARLVEIKSYNQYLQPCVQQYYKVATKKQEVSYSLDHCEGLFTVVQKKVVITGRNQHIEKKYTFLDTTNIGAIDSLSLKQLQQLPYQWVTTRRLKYDSNQRLQEAIYKNRDSSHRKIVYEYDGEQVVSESHFRDGRIEQVEESIYDNNKRLIQAVSYRIDKKTGLFYPKVLKYTYYHPVWNKVVQYREGAIEIFVEEEGKLYSTTNVRIALPSNTTALKLKDTTIFPSIFSANYQKSLAAWQRILLHDSLTKAVQKKYFDIEHHSPVYYLAQQQIGTQTISIYANVVSEYLENHAYDEQGREIYKEEDYLFFYNAEKHCYYQQQDSIDVVYTQKIEVNPFYSGLEQIEGWESLEQYVKGKRKMNSTHQIVKKFPWASRALSPIEAAPVPSEQEEQLAGYLNLLQQKKVGPLTYEKERAKHTELIEVYEFYE